MNELEKMLHTLRLVSDLDAPAHLSEMLRMAASRINTPSIRQTYESAAEGLTAESCWETVYEAICLAGLPDWLNSASESEPEDVREWTYEGQAFFGDLAKHCKKRQKRLDAIRLTVSPQAMHHVMQFTNLDNGNIGTELVRQIELLGFSEYPAFKLPSKMSAEERLETVSCLRDTLIQKDLGRAYRDPATMNALDRLEALYGMLLWYFNEHQNKKFIVSPSLIAFPEFVYCDKCWRLIPESYARRQMTRCDLHNYETGKSTDSRKAKSIYDTFVEGNPVFSKADSLKLKALDSVWKPDFSSIDECIWQFVLKSKLGDRVTLEALPQCTYDLEPIWKVCPHTRTFLESQHCSLDSVRNILLTLDPHLADETTQEYELRECLHVFLSRNFWFYRLDLARAEVWLSLYATQYAERKHGGRREGTGGKRPGAGRPRKNTA